MDFSAGVGEVVAISGIIVTVVLWVLSQGKEDSRDMLAREARDWQRQARADDTLPNLKIELSNAGHFPGYGVLPEGDSYRLKPPSGWIAPQSLLIATVLNVGSVPVTLTQVGIRLNRTGAEMEVPREREVNDAEGKSTLPHVLEPRSASTLSMDWPLLRRMLGVLQADEADQFGVWVADGIGTRYRSPSRSAWDILNGLRNFEIAVNFESPVTIVQIGEEEHFPDGIIPWGTDNHEGTKG